MNPKSPISNPQSVRLETVTKRFGSTLAVSEVSVDIQPGEFFSLLGPSGCGKTTLLRMVAGFEQPDAGHIFIGGEEVTKATPQRRPTAMVFQSYALFPTMTVAQNVAYGLDVRRVAKAERARRVEEALARVELAGLGPKPVTQLSGGQQQRVALARALAVRPAVLLFDEPLSNLDVTLREQTRRELKELQAQLGTTSIYVTHDQQEALALSDRIAVMRAG
ncbi:MAG TPA: ABC transporter ATP-binding protein, partial [Rhodothermales bacterium]|nr:ABC transporter ATP-binding protein [Rhodothermales bacterium]